MKKGDFVFNIVRVPADFLMLVCGGIATYAIRTEILDQWRPVLFGPQLPLGRFFVLVLAVSALFVVVYAISGLYAMKLRMTVPQEISRVVVASSAAMMLVILAIFVRAEAFNSRFLVLGYWLMAIGAVVCGRLLMRAVYRRLTVRYDLGAHQVLLIGNDDVARRLAETMCQDLALGYRVVRVLDDPDPSAVAATISDPGVHEVILASPEYPAERIIQLVELCHEHHVIFKFVPNIYRTLTTHYDVDSIGRIPLIQLRRTALDGWGRVFKRVTDIAGSALALAVLAPVFGLVAFAIKWETEGPALVRLRRMSRSREFDLLKFRSMIDRAHELNGYLRSLGNDRRDGGPLWKMKDDPRITKVGRFIRKYRIDEFPQFWNVLRGDMSLVGPRPHQPDEIAKYERHHRRVLAIKAGATGMVQSSGASDMPFEEEVALDTFYIENWSWWLDMRIIGKTAVRLLSDRSAV
ncbi:MAG: sugar transferase [Candidatus Yanofskybacteria bacterium]|nr:sugar transferase [Candidatus Yanofskybacteria bacterium]